MFEKREINGDTYVSVAGGASDRGWFSLYERTRPDWEQVRETDTLSLPEDSRRVSTEAGLRLIREGKSGDYPITAGKMFLYPVVLEIHQKEIPSAKG